VSPILRPRLTWISNLCVATKDSRTVGTVFASLFERNWIVSCSNEGVYSSFVEGTVSRVGMSTFRFFVIENNSFFAFVHGKTNVSLFFTYSLRQF
jgi:hypothetical protein